MTTQTTSRWIRRGAGVVLALLAAPGLAACSDDATADPTTTTIAETVEQFGVRIDAECPGSDPGFDPFYTEHPTPTAADYAAFLPAPLAMVREVRDCVNASNPPAVIADDIDAVVAAFDVVISDFEKALAAASAGDLATTERWITEMHDVDQPKIDEAIAGTGLV